MTYHLVCSKSNTMGATSGVVHKLLTLPEHMSSRPVFSGVRVTQCLFFYVVLCRSLFVLLSLFCWSLCY
jgi:hypothetical protein